MLAPFSLESRPNKRLFLDQGSQQNRLSRSPVSLEVGSNRSTCVTDGKKSLIESRVVNLKRLLSFVTAGLKNGEAATAPNSSAAAGHGSEWGIVQLDERERSAVYSVLGECESSSRD